MSPRMHIVLRVLSMLVLVSLIAWPRSRSGGRDRDVAHVAAATHLAVTTAARRDERDAPRPARLRGEDVPLVSSEELADSFDTIY